jgi:hypothetical protein
MRLRTAIVLAITAVWSAASRRVHAQSAPWAIAQHATVTLRDGRVVEGVIASVHVGVDVIVRQADGTDETFRWDDIALSGAALRGGARVTVGIGPPTVSPLERTVAAGNWLARQPGTLPVVVEHTGAPLEIGRIEGTHTEIVTSRDHRGNAYAYPAELIDTAYVCTTPCTLFLPPGPTTLHFSAENAVAANLALDPGAGGQRYRVAAAGDFRGIGGFLLSFLSVPASLGGGAVVGLGIATAASSSPQPDAISTMLLTGGALIGVFTPLAALGIYLFATRNTRIVRHEPLAARGPQWVGASVVPSTTGRGASIGAGFVF